MNKDPATILMRRPRAMMPYIFLSCAFVYLIIIDIDIMYKLIVKTFLMPFLALWVDANLGSLAPSLMYPSLVFATLGDFFLDFHIFKGEKGPWFIIGMASFLLMQVMYIKAFRALPLYTGPSKLSIVAYLLTWCSLNYFILPSLPSDL